MGVESTSKCKIIIFFCRTRILVFENLVSVSSSVYFLLYHCNLSVCEIIEVSLLWYVLPDELVRIFNRSFLP